MTEQLDGYKRIRAATIELVARVATSGLDPVQYIIEDDSEDIENLVLTLAGMSYRLDGKSLAASPYMPKCETAATRRYHLIEHMIDHCLNEVVEQSA